ncbi:hypothetical protein [Synechococcus sp. MIT S9508]|nr:hypothetical protein [Synechococcus sp. MIT S9508]
MRSPSVVTKGGSVTIVVQAGMISADAIDMFSHAAVPSSHS